MPGRVSAWPGWAGGHVDGVAGRVSAWPGWANVVKPQEIRGNIASFMKVSLFFHGFKSVNLLILLPISSFHSFKKDNSYIRYTAPESHIYCTVPLQKDEKMKNSPTL